MLIQQDSTIISKISFPILEHSTSIKFYFLYPTEKLQLINSLYPMCTHHFQTMTLSFFFQSTHTVFQFLMNNTRTSIACAICLNSLSFILVFATASLSTSVILTYIVGLIDLIVNFLLLQPVRFLSESEHFSSSISEFSGIQLRHSMCFIFI